MLGALHRGCYVRIGRDDRRDTSDIGPNVLPPRVRGNDNDGRQAQHDQDKCPESVLALPGLKCVVCFTSRRKCAVGLGDVRKGQGAALFKKVNLGLTTHKDSVGISFCLVWIS
jgi:hypothetical protein